MEIFLENNKKLITCENNNVFQSELLKLYSKRIHVFRDSNSNYYFNKTNKVCVSILGYIANLKGIKKKYKIKNSRDVEIVEELYSQKCRDFINKLDGVFTIFIWDKTKEFVYIFQNRNGSDLPLYYLKTDNRILISTSLRKVLSKISRKPKLCLNAVTDFLKVKFIVPNKATFIKNIYKLLPNKYLAINVKKGTVTQKKIKQYFYYCDVATAKKLLLERLYLSIKELYSQLTLPKGVCKLSSGYDSNTILYYLSKLTNNITVCTIGGENINEIESVKKILKHYDEVKLISSVVEQSMLDKLPEIIWITEGYVCEKGIFLQYELASKLSKYGIDKVFCGECADQILDSDRNYLISNFFLRDLKLLCLELFKNKVAYERFRENTIIRYLRYPILKIDYNVEADYIMKKSGLILNHFGIQGVYPYLNKTFSDTCYTLRKINRNKKYFKKALSKIFNHNVFKHFRKIGGTTDIEYLFTNKNIKLEKLLRSKLLTEIMPPHKREYLLTHASEHYDLILRILYIYIFNEIFILGNHDFSEDKFNGDLKWADVL